MTFWVLPFCISCAIFRTLSYLSHILCNISRVKRGLSIPVSSAVRGLNSGSVSSSRVLLTKNIRSADWHFQQFCLRLRVSIICYRKKMILVLGTNNYVTQRHCNHPNDSEQLLYHIVYVTTNKNINVKNCSLYKR